MKFKEPHLEVEFREMHPDVRDVLVALDAWSVKHRIPETVVTHVFRGRAFMEETYWLGIAKKLTIQLPNASPAEVERIARETARMKFSWHLVRCAADIRNRHYTKEEREDVFAWLRVHCKPPMFELVQHDVGKGDHIHVGRKDLEWKTRFNPKEQSCLRSPP